MSGQDVMIDAGAAGGLRAGEARAFLDAAGWTGATIAAMAGDASARRYARVCAGGRRAVLMDAPPDAAGPLAPFLAMTGYLRARGFSAPEILAADEARGFLLLEDLGEGLFARICARHPEREGALYAAAAELLAELHALPPPERIGDWALRPYDEPALWAEAQLIARWWLPAATGAEASPALEDELRGLLAEALGALCAAREAVVLRDYHAENLIWLPGRSGVARVGLLDYQDALAGAAAYDLVSLLEDARRDTSAELRAATLARYARARGVAADELRARCARLGAQRNIKIMGIFARLWLRDGKPQYLAMLPRVHAHLRRDLEQPGLERLRAFIERRVPPPTPGVLARVRAARA
ncbi:aminoglycoside phosphotransferase family protein [Oceanicella actignis]|uniref:aminoglycoside phosphotransferase family protein n=1 Tax=Oceanicella actignis TaxID=1189325 RepID=UPI001251974B|nr:phosphotransferase [Oceanicella actignis]TYO84804.1 hypothetical protein LY05_02865 [Oceanicella actignis]